MLKSGDKVLIYSNVKLGQSKKLHRFWSGPYTVLEKTSPGVYKLRNDATSQRVLRHVRMLRLFNSADITNQPTDNSEAPPSESLESEESDEIDSDSDAPPPLPPKQTRVGRLISLPKRFLD